MWQRESGRRNDGEKEEESVFQWCWLTSSREPEYWKNGGSYLLINTEKAREWECKYLKVRYGNLAAGGPFNTLMEWIE